ncbi:MAG: DUF1830 domain-containing protein [Leptolyngbyaceae cyanobacterium MAG.088]|nr:DUF1830 domain-containing protein [Leptolyngbyaceae cyanobacterium MAG.088]
MTQTLDPIPFDDTNIVLCCYMNSSSKIQVARITNISNWYFERVVFPGQRLLFEANIESLLEIHSGSMASSILEDRIPCSRLRVDQAEDSLGNMPMTSMVEGGASSTVSAM